MIINENSAALAERCLKILPKRRIPIRRELFSITIIYLGLFAGSMEVPCLAQSITPSTGLHYYAVLDADSGQVIERGKTGSEGVAFDQLILAPNTHYRIWVL